jgi:hypothetical protein
MLENGITTAVPPTSIPKYIASNHALPDTAATAQYLTPAAERHCTYAESPTKDRRSASPVATLSAPQNGYKFHSQKSSRQPPQKDTSSPTSNPVPWSPLANYDNWPGLTAELIANHLPKSMATSKGHLRMQQKNLQSTKTTVAPLPLATSLDISPAQEPQNATTQNVFVATVTETDIRKSYSGQTSRFPVRSSCGNQYVFVLYDFDSNDILTHPLHNRQAKEITNA